MILLPIIVIIMRIPPALRHTIACCAFMALLMLGLPSSLSRAEEINGQQKALLMREGAKLQSVVGTVTQSGQRWSFITEQKRSYRLLENLTLQRLIRSIQRDAEDRRWVVDGQVTEFMDENFLLLSRTQRSVTSSQE